MAKETVIYRRRGFQHNLVPENMNMPELLCELEKKLISEKMIQQELNEQQLLIRELELHQLELEIQNRELIESQRSLAIAKTKYINLYDFSPVGYVTLGATGKILEINITAAKYLNKEKHAICGKSFSSWITKDYKRSFNQHLNNCLHSEQHEQQTVELQLAIPGKRDLLNVELHSTISYDLQTQKIIINMAIVDLTEIKKSEILELRTREQDQERSLRSDFIAALSHDLRTPLTSSKLCAQMINNEPMDPIKQKKLFHMMVDELDRADRMIKELLDANKIKGNDHLPLVKNRCNFSELVKKSVEQFRCLHAMTKIELHVEEDIIGLWSKDGLHRILENLIFNAIKYGNKERNITITLTRNETDALLQVHNFGNPISMRDQKRIFSVFARTDSATHSNETGWGLGLNLVSTITRSHNGQLKVKSNTLEGTFFSVILPLEN